jgi:hypothetical protein
VLNYGRTRKVILATGLSAMLLVSLTLALAAFAAPERPSPLAGGGVKPKIGCMGRVCEYYPPCWYLEIGVAFRCCDNYCWHPAGYWWCKTGWFCCGSQIAYQYGCDVD